MLEELKLKNDDLKGIINKIEELTPWDREQLFEDIYYLYNPPEETPEITVDNLLDYFDSYDICSKLYYTDSYLELAEMLCDNELTEFVERAIDESMNRRDAVNHLLDDLYDDYTYFTEWIEEKRKDDADFDKFLSTLLTKDTKE